MNTLLLAALIGSASGLQLGAVAPRPAFALRAARTASICMEDKPWNTATDDKGDTYYWRGSESTYEMPADFDPALARDAGTYKAGGSTDGALYDDEIVDGPITYKDGSKKQELSNTMRERLINESRGLGADPNQKNPFLFVFAGVGVFVLLGAAAVNM